MVDALYFVLYKASFVHYKLSLMFMQRTASEHRLDRSQCQFLTNILSFPPQNCRKHFVIVSVTPCSHNNTTGVFRVLSK